MNGSINFLDMTINRTDDSISTVATTLTDRAIAFTNPTDRPKSINKVKELLAENGYPQQFVSRIIEQRVHSFYNGKECQEKMPEQRFISAPYIPGLSERLKKSLNKFNLTLSC